MLGLLHNAKTVRAARALDVARGVAAAMAGGEAMASLMRDAGVPAEAVAGMQMRDWAQGVINGGDSWR